MKTLSREDYLDLLKAQGVPREHLAFICPACATVQSIHDFIVAGVDPAKAEEFVGFSCIGRLTHRKAPPLLKDRGTQIGCNWTLGGLLGIHVVEIIGEDGKHHPVFEIANAELAQRHMKGEQIAIPVPETGVSPARCRVCGCTDHDCSGCIRRTGEPCHWVEPDLCSACVAQDPKPAPRRRHGQGERRNG